MPTHIKKPSAIPADRKQLSTCDLGIIIRALALPLESILHFLAIRLRIL